MGRQVTRRLLAYAAVYLLWGASFLAVRELVQAAPPLLIAGVRFVIAGALLLLWAAVIRAPWPDARALRSTVLLGLTMFTVNYGLLFWAEQTVASGYAAIFSSTIPIFVVLGEWLWLGAGKPDGFAAAGIAFGLSGVTLLAWPHGESAAWTLPALGLLAGALCWALGTLWSRRLPMPKSRHVSSGLQMGLGGVFLLLSSGVAGEWRRVPDTLRIWTPRLTADLIYLILFASIAAFFAFVWLIEHEPASRVTTHTFVNPLIAIAVGAWIAQERFSQLQMAGAALVIAGVISTHWRRRTPLAATAPAVTRRG